jgi:adenine-specific DNA-methyltransferase
MQRLDRAGRLFLLNNKPAFKTFYKDFEYMQIDTTWSDKPAARAKIYAVETATKFIARCMLMCTDPGDLVVDPTCGSGTTAFAAEQWGRRWVTIDTSRVALAVARQRLTVGQFEYYELKDSINGARKETELTGRPSTEGPFQKDIRQGFVYERVPHITLKSIANNVEIDVIYEKWQRELEPLREALNRALGRSWEEWEIPREAGDGWAAQAKDVHANWWAGRRARQAEIDASIAKNAETEYLYDRPYGKRPV